MFIKLRIKLKMLWLVLRAESVHMTFQYHPSEAFKSLAFGHSSLKDLVLFAKELKVDYDGLIDMINNVAAEAGELHALQELKEAVEVIQDGRD